MIRIDHERECERFYENRTSPAFCLCIKKYINELNDDIIKLSTENDRLALELANLKLKRLKIEKR